MKQKWERPTTMIQVFELNEYVAACNTYVCSSGYTAATIFIDSNGNGYYDQGTDVEIGTTYSDPYNAGHQIEVNQNQIGYARMTEYPEYSDEPTNSIMYYQEGNTFHVLGSTTGSTNRS